MGVQATEEWKRERLRKSADRIALDVLQRDSLIEQMERSQQRLQSLYDISTLLSRFQTVEQTVPEVMSLVSLTLPLRSAIFLDTAGKSRVLAWQADGEQAQQLREAREHAEATFACLVSADVTVDSGEAPPLPLPALTALQARLQPKKSAFVLLPFVSHGAIVGALQIESARTLEESDLEYVNAVVNQLATALNRDVADRALRASEAKLAGIISLAMDAVISIDKEHNIVMFNEGAERMFGWSRSEAVGKPIESLLAERVRDEHRSYIQAFAEGTELSGKMGAGQGGTVARRKSGEEFPAEAAISKLNVAGEWLYTIMLRDISEQIRAQHEAAFLGELSTVLASTLNVRKALVNIAELVRREFGSFCSVEFVDEYGKLSEIEVVTSDLDKANIAEALKRFPLDRTRPHLSDRILQADHSLLIEEFSSATLRAMAQNAEHLRLLQALELTTLMGVPLFVGGRLLGTLVVASSDRSRRYGQSDVQLLAEVGRRAALALESARLYGAAQQAVAARDDILGIVAHDLQNPLSIILLQVALLRRLEGDSGRSSRPGEIIGKAATRMSRLIRDLLDLTSMEAGHLSVIPARARVAPLLAEAVEAQRSLALSRKLALRLDVAANLPEVCVDHERLLQVLENLISNAAKFTPPEGQIVVGARVQPREDELLFWVSDTGTGVAAEDLPHLFDRFWQALKSERSGAGLGLPIAKGIIEAHGGRIWAESTVGSGSTFYFTVPLARD